MPIRTEANMQMIFAAQDRRWQTVHRKMEASLTKHKENGNIPTKTKEQIILDQLVPEQTRLSVLEQFLKSLVSV